MEDRRQRTIPADHFGLGQRARPGVEPQVRYRFSAQAIPAWNDLRGGSSGIARPDRAWFRAQQDFGETVRSDNGFETPDVLN